MEQEHVSKNGKNGHDAQKARGKKIRVAIVGVGNCASSLIQGRYYYENAKPGDFVPGLMHVKLGDYHISDVEFVAAFDIDKEPAIRATRKQQRLAGIVGISLHGTEEDHVVTTIIAIDGSTLEIGNALGKHRSVAEARSPIDAGELVLGRFGELVCKSLLRIAEHVDGEVACVLKYDQAR